MSTKFSKQFSFKRSLPCAALTLTLSWLVSAALAVDNNPAGTWKASFTIPDGQTIESTFKLKHDGDKLSGIVIGRNGNETPMDEVKLTGDQLSFKLTRERNGEKVTTKVVATLSGDNLKGKLESNYGGENRTADWQAKREGSAAITAASGAGDAAGIWKFAVTIESGDVLNMVLDLKQEGEKVTGKLTFSEFDVPITEGKITGDAIFIKTPIDAGGQNFTIKYNGTLSGDTIKGKVESDYGGEDHKYDWNASRSKAASTALAVATGDWKYTINIESGDTMNLVLNLKQAGDTVTGKVTVGDFEAPITEGKVAGDVISFKIPVDTGGQKFTSKYNGTITGDTIKGKIQSDFGGEDRNYEWVAKREKTADSATTTAGSGGAAGTWKWVLVTEGGDSIDLSLKLKQDGDKLTGVVILGDNETPILDGLIKDNEVTLKVTRDQDGKTLVSKFKGKLDGDTIKGKIDSDWSGQDRTYDWNAKREKAAASATTTAAAGGAAGTWKWVLVTEAGDSIDLSLKLKQDGDKLTGVVILGDSETPISDGLITDNEVTLKVTRDQDGKTLVSKFKGKLEGDTIKGKIDSDWSGQDRTYDWNAKRSS